MRSSLKKIFAGVLVVAMLVTTYSFDSLAVTLDTLVTKESTINQERNKNNQTKYFEQFLNEKNQLLMKGDEGDGSVLTTMPTDNQDDKNTDTTTQNKDVVITTMPSDDKISPDDFADEKTEDDLINDLIDDKIGESIKIQISIDDEDIKDNKDFAVDNTALINDIDDLQEENEKVVIKKDTGSYNEENDNADGVFGGAADTEFADFLVVPYGIYTNEYTKALDDESYRITYKDAANSTNRVYTIPITKAFKNYLIYRIKGRNDTDVVHFDTNIIEYDDFIKYHSESKFIRFIYGGKAMNEDTGELEPAGWGFDMTAYDPDDYYNTLNTLDKNGEVIYWLESSGGGAISNAYTGMYLTRNNDNSITVHFVQRTNKFLDSFEIPYTSYVHGTMHLKWKIPPYKVRIIFDDKENTQTGTGTNFTYKNVKWVIGDGATWLRESAKFDTYKEYCYCGLPGTADIVKEGYMLEGWYINDDRNTAHTWLYNQTGDITLTAKWTEYIDIPISMFGAKDNSPHIFIKPDKTKWKSQLGLDGIEKIEELTSGGIDTLGKTLIQTIKYQSTEFRSIASNRLIISALKTYYGMGENDAVIADLNGNEFDFYNYDIFNGNNGNGPDYDHLKHANIVANIYEDYEGRHYVNLTQGSIYYYYDGGFLKLPSVGIETNDTQILWDLSDINMNAQGEDETSKQTRRIKIPTELIYRKDGYNTAAKAHVIRPQEAEDFYQVLGLNKDEIGSINLGWAADHRPKEAYEIIDYYSDLRVKGNWSGQEKSIDPVEANTVNAALLYNESSKKYDVYLFGMYALWRLDGQYYGIYWDLDEIADEIKQDTGIDIKKHESKVNWVIGDDAAWLRQKAKFDTYEEGTAHALPTSDDIARVGYTLDGWYINSDKSKTYTSIPNTQTGEITLTAKWIEREYVDLPISMMKTKSGNGNIHITPDKTKWKSQLGLDGEKIESLTHGDLDTTGKTLVNTIKYKSTEFRGLDSQQIIASALRIGFNLDENAKVQFMEYSGNDSIRDFTTNQVYDASYDHIEKANIVAKVYKDNEGKVYVDLTEGSTSGAFQFYLPSLTAFCDSFPKLLWDLSDIDLSSQGSSTEEDDEYQEGYDITWVLGDGKFKDEYKSYENALHKTTEDFILPGAEALDAPYRKILKEWIIGGVATTSISKDIHAPVTVVAVWTRSVGNFESYSIGKYKSSSLDTEEETALEWIILDKVDGKLLLTTKDIIDNKSYDTNGNAKFENSSISSWLNGEFYNQVFNDDQKVNILKEGKDKVFLLTEREAKDYFANDIQRTSKATDHAIHVDNGGENLDVKNGLAAYWLMTDVDGNKAPYVTQNGIVNTEGIDVASKNIGVRPCIWVSETKISNIRSNPLNKLIDTINNQIEHFANFMNLFFGRKK